VSQRAQAKAGRLAHDLSRPEDLFADFIVAESKAYGEALMSNEAQIQELIALYAMISRVRVGCSQRTFVCREDHARTDRRVRRTQTRRSASCPTNEGGMRIDPLRTSPRPREELRTFSSP
jgi:hypothetical protein